MSIDGLIEQLVEQKVQEYIGSIARGPDLLTPQETAEICKVDVSVIHSLIKTQDFPAVRLSPRITKIDRQRLNVWLQSGGLNKATQ